MISRKARYLFGALIGFSIAIPLGATQLPESTRPGVCPPSVASSAGLLTPSQDPEADDTSRIQAALDALHSGYSLILAPGIYHYSKSLALRTAGTAICGENAMLVARTPADEALLSEADDVVICGLTISGTSTERLSNTASAQIVIKGNRNTVCNNVIFGGASAGIILYGAAHFSVYGNDIYDTRADGIHMTHGSSSGTVEHNRVFHTGDDMISVVSYRGNDQTQPLPPQSHDIIIQNNTVSGNYIGRGISVVGGDKITIENNYISHVISAAGILIAQESSYHTFGSSNINIKRNFLQYIEVDENIYHSHVSAHGAIDINSSGEDRVYGIVIEENVIESHNNSGVRIHGDICDVSLERNKITPNDRIEVDSGSAQCKATGQPAIH